MRVRAVLGWQAACTARADVAEFVVEDVPAEPGSPSTGDSAAMAAFDLKANGITLEQELDSALAETLTIPR